MIRYLLFSQFLALHAVNTTECIAQSSFPVQIRVDASQELGQFREIWRFFGADEPNYAYMPHGSKLVTQHITAFPGAARTVDRYKIYRLTDNFLVP